MFPFVYFQEPKSMKLVCEGFILPVRLTKYGPLREPIQCYISQHRLPSFFADTAFTTKTSSEGEPAYRRAEMILQSLAQTGQQLTKKNRGNYQYSRIPKVTPPLPPKVVPPQIKSNVNCSQFYKISKVTVLSKSPLDWTGLYCAVLCCAVLCCAVLCCAVLCCAVLCCAVLCCAVLCCAVLCCAVLCCAVLCCAVLCCAVLCCAVLCCAVLCCAVLCCAVLCCAVLCCAVLCCAVLCCAVLCCPVRCCAVLCGAVL